MYKENNGNTPVLIEKHKNLLSIVLNRPKVLNSLNHEMVKSIKTAIDKAKEDNSIRTVLFYGAGTRGFCAGADIKAMAQSVREGNINQCLQFLEAEYALDLEISRFPKPVIVLADGITMGGGLGLSAGADIVLATERTRTAMPETRIGFFPDVGATGWMHDKCLPGYPEFLGLTGHEMTGAECVRVGFATHLLNTQNLSLVPQLLKNLSTELSLNKPGALDQIISLLDPLLNKDIPQNPEMDAWVKTYFDGKISIVQMLEDLRACSLFNDLCEEVFQRLSERSPTAPTITLQLLHLNKGRPLENVYKTDLKAASFILSHPDYIEGIRARLIDKDDRPSWQPESIDKIGTIDFLNSRHR
ncbi:MAG: enoyl-CoA hydratase/isomerase family protein [Pseudomonadota bacterium]